MGDKYTVYWSQTAKDDLSEIIEYISKDSPQTAINILDSLNKQMIYTDSPKGEGSYRN